jgi:hypothetical protein
MALSNRGNVVFVKEKPRVVVNQSGLVARKIGDLVDVDTTGKVDGSLLIYDEDQEKFVASTILQNQILNGGNF